MVRPLVVWDKLNLYTTKPYGTLPNGKYVPHTIELSRSLHVQRKEHVIAHREQ